MTKRFDALIRQIYLAGCKLYFSDDSKNMGCASHDALMNPNCVTGWAIERGYKFRTIRRAYTVSCLIHALTPEVKSA